MKNIFLFFILIFVINAFATEIDWNTTEIRSKSHFSFLEDNFDVTDYLYIRRKPQNRTRSELAISSLSNFGKAVRNFFSNEHDISHFIQIHTINEVDNEAAERSIFQRHVPRNSYLYFDLFTGADYFSNISQQSQYSYVYYGTKLFANINNTLFVDGYWWTGHFNGDEDLLRTSPILDSWSQNTSDIGTVSIDNSSGKIVYKKDFFMFGVGRGKHVIGNNISGSIILNDACNDYGYFMGKLDFKKFTISLMHGTLIPDSTNTDQFGNYIYKDYNDKYIVVKKLDWQPTVNLHFFAGEEVIYGNRSIDPSYLLPQTFLRATEHNLSDRDNVLIFGGINFKPFQRNIIYTNIILDELSKSKIFTDWWGNKYAIQIGNSYRISGLTDARISFEFTAVRPWLYTHKILHNKYSHDGIGLGFPDGSNLIQYAGEFHYGILKKISVNLHAAYTKQGELGNDFSINYETRPDDTATWLEGEITERAEIRTVFRWQPLTHHKIIFGHSVEKIDNDKPLHQLSISYQASY